MFHGSYSRAPDSVGNLLVFMLFCDSSAIDCRGRSERFTQQPGLRIVAIFEPGSATGVSLTRSQEVFESLWSAKCACLFEYLDDCRVA